MHDADLWAWTDIGQAREAGKLSPYCLVGDAAYPCHPWMLAPFKGHKDGLSCEEYHWNFVQSLTRMCVERAFGMLKGIWRILLKRIDVHFEKCVRFGCTMFDFAKYVHYFRRQVLETIVV